MSIKNLFIKLEEAKKLTAPLIKEFSQFFGETFFKALEYLEKEEGALVKNIFLPSETVLWTIKGKSSDYILYRGLYCQCKNFQIDILFNEKNRKIKYCKHLLALEFAIIFNKYEIREFHDKEWKDWIKQWR